MANSIANLLLKIASQKGDAVSDVAEVAAALEALDHTSAEATAQVDTDQLSFDTLVAELEAFDHKKVDAKAEVDAKNGLRQLELFTQKLEGIQSKTFSGKFFGGGAPGEFTQMFSHGDQQKVDVNLDTKKAEAEAVSFKALLQFILGRQTVDIDVDRSGRTTKALGSLTDAFGSLGSAGAGLGKSMAGLAEGFGGVTVNLGMFGLKLGPLVGVVLALAGAIVVSLVAALAALAASAVLAATALAALGVALVAAIGPMIAVAIPAILVFGKVLKVLQQQQTEAATAAQRAAQQEQQAAQKRAAAIQATLQASAQARRFAQQHADAERALTDAITSAADARVQAYREMQDAIERVSDSVRALQNAQLSQEQAHLNVKKADLALKKFREDAGLAGKEFDAMFKTFNDVAFDPTKLNQALAKIKGPGKGLDAGKKIDLEQLILDQKKARQDEKGAIDDVSDAERDHTRAVQGAKPFIDQGITGSKNYKAALDRVATAQRNLSQLESDRRFDLKQQAALSKAQADVTKTSMLKSVSATKALSDQQKSLLGHTKRLIKSFKDAFGPATKGLIDGIITAMGFLAAAMKPLRNPLKGLGEAMGGAIADFAKFMTTPDMQGLFTTLIAGATTLAPLISKIFQPLLSILGKVAQAAMPLLVAGFQAFAGWLGKLDKKTTVADIANGLKKIVPYLKDWFDLAKALFPVFVDLLIAIAPYAKDIMKYIGGVAKRLGDWLKSKKGRAEIKKFFEDTLPLLITFVQSAFFLANALLQIAGGVGKLKKAFDDLTNLKLPGPDWLWSSDAFSKKISNIDWGGLASSIWDGFIAGLKFSGNAVLDQLLGPVRNAYNSLKDFLGIGSPSKLFFQVGSDIMTGLFNGIKAVPGQIFGWIRDKFTGVIAWLKGLPGRFFNFGSKTISSLWNGIKSIGFSVWSWITGKFQAAIDFLKNLPDRMYNWGRDLIRGLWNGIKSTPFSVWGWIKGKFEAAITYLKNLPGRFWELGKNIAKGLWDGIKSKAHDWKKAIVDKGKDAFKGVKDFFRSKSPSKLMLDLGYNVGRGFELGIDASSARVSRAATRSFALPTVAAAASSAAARGMTIQQQTVNLPAAPGHDQMGDPRHQAAQFAREMRRRGRR